MASTSGSSAACAIERHDRVVTLVWVMQQDVAGVDGGEDVLCHRERVHCLNRRIAQLGVAGQIEERHQQPQVSGPSTA
ncbi:MAG: hypothetical protein QM736_15420 [Vicinamibacterales bacterium]